MADSKPELAVGLKLKLEETLLPSLNSIDLQRTAESDYLYRFASSAPQVAEVFHENSKLLRSSTLVVPDGDEQVHDLREWFFTNSYTFAADDFNNETQQPVKVEYAELPETLRKLVEPFAWDETRVKLLYGLDLFLLLDDLLLRVLPRRSFLWIERKFDGAARADLRKALIGMPEDAWQEARGLLFVSASPWRYMLLYGPRGYRHTLMDAGRLLSEIDRAAAASRFAALTVQNFYDHPVDELLMLDGLERSALAVVALREMKS